MTFITKIDNKKKGQCQEMEILDSWPDATSLDWKIAVIGKSQCSTKA
jgi:hypothetical protein